MSRTLSNQFLAEITAQESGDPFLMLLTLNHTSFSAPYYLVNNTEDITSRSQVYTAYPMQIVLPADSHDSDREIAITLDNVGLLLIEDLRSVTTPISVTLELILASQPDTVEIELGELKIKNINYDKDKITARLYLDDFLNTELTSEKYTPTNFPGIF